MGCGLGTENFKSSWETLITANGVHTHIKTARVLGNPWRQASGSEGQPWSGGCGGAQGLCAVAAMGAGLMRNY